MVLGVVPTGPRIHNVSTGAAPVGMVQGRGVGPAAAWDCMHGTCVATLCSDHVKLSDIKLKTISANQVSDLEDCSQ